MIETILLMAMPRDRRQRSEPRAPDHERRTPEAGPPDGNGQGWHMNGNLPVWLQAVKTIGLSGTLLGFLIWVGSQEVPKMRDELAVMNRNLIAQQLAITELSKQVEAQNQMLRRICSVVARNGGKDDAECWK
jgi:hypothetical protein